MASRKSVAVSSSHFVESFVCAFAVRAAKATAATTSKSLFNMLPPMNRKLSCAVSVSLATGLPSAGRHELRNSCAIPRVLARHCGVHGMCGDRLSPDLNRFTRESIAEQCRPVIGKRIDQVTRQELSQRIACAGQFNSAKIGYDAAREATMNQYETERERLARQ